MRFPASLTRWMFVRRSGVGPLAVAALALSWTPFASAPAAAAVIAVNTFEQTSAQCSLANAIRSANADADTGGCVHSGAYGADTIVLPAGTYALSGVDSASTGLPTVTSDITIRGNGSTTARTHGESG